MKSEPEAEVIGFFNIVKPVGITSHDVVARVRKLTAIKQVGHAGTLDPLASGVMVVAVGKACRLLRFLSDDKAYLAEILLGVQTETDDMEGAIIESKPVPATLTNAQIASELQKFSGEINQIPPIYSAIHVKGERLYNLARSGADLAALDIEIPTRQVTINDISLVDIALPVVTARIDCSKGTYIRSIARDLGAALGLGGTLKSLVRERSGTFDIGEAQSFEQLAELKAQGRELLLAAMCPVEKALPLSQIVCNEEQISKFCMGQKVSMPAPENCNLSVSQFVLIRQDNPEQTSTLVGKIDAIDLQQNLCVISPEVVFSNAKKA
ncbi:MAG: tRNA pseudouridine(55) synthase TruB [Candidatus Melainabacteria bacterium]|nr:tRNA pseudouridine(55) synthase TruB [Candidatus Melainabacteria bacterium]